MSSATRRHRWGAASLLLFVGGIAIATETPPTTPGPETREAFPRAWLSDQVDPQDALQAIARHNERILAVGSKGLVIESLDGARSWLREPLANRPPLIDIAVCPDGQFFLLDFRRGLWVFDRAIGSWKRIPIELSNAASAPRSLALRCGPGGALWAVGEESSILRSDDGGRRWRSTLPDGSDRLLTGVGFVGPDRVRVVGEFGSYFESDNGGGSWRRGPDIPGEFYPHAAHVATDGTMWAVGNTGHVYRLDPGAKAWREESSGTERALYGIARVGESLVAVGAGGIALSRNESWRALPVLRSGETARDWRGVVGLGGGPFVAVGAGGLMRFEPAAVLTSERVRREAAGPIAGGLMRFEPAAP